MIRSVGRFEGGSISAFVALLAVALFALLGLVVDGGRAVSDRLAVAAVAEQAARAGADQVSVAALHSGQVEVDPTAARSAAMALLGAAGVEGTVVVVGESVSVHATFDQPTVILGIVGIDSMSGTVDETATDVHGVSRED